MIATLPKTYYNKNHEKQHSKEKLMKKIKKLTSLLFCCLFLYLLAFPGQVQAASLTPTAQDNLSVKLRRSSDLISPTAICEYSAKQTASVLNTMTTACRLQTKEKFPWSFLYGVVFMQDLMDITW